MATLKLTIDAKRSYSDGRVPIIYRLTHNTKTTRIESGIRVNLLEWDNVKCRINKVHPKHKELNLVLNKKLLDMEKRLYEVVSNDTYGNIASLKQALLNKDKQHLFYDFATKEIEDLRTQGRFGNAQAYETAVNRLIKHAGKDILLSKIDYTLICEFDVQLTKERLSRNSVAAYMREIRALLNTAIKKKLVNRDVYPFSSYKIKTEKTVNRAITKQDIQIIRDLNLKEESKRWHSRNIFMLIYNLIGISFTDLALLKPSSIQNGRIVYRRRKTGKIYSIKITDEAHRIFSLYKQENSKYLIPMGLNDIPKSLEKEEIALRLSTCNKYLKKIGVQLGLPIPLTTYVARYTWANVAKSLGFPKDQIAEALGHSYGNRVTGIYLDNYGNEVIDEMNEKVTGD